MKTYPMTFKSLDTSTTLGALVDLPRARSAELPHLDSPVQATADKILAARREGNAVNTVFVSIGTFQSFDKVARSDVPDTDTLIQRSCCHKLAIWRNGNSRHAILNAQCEDVGLCLDIPKSDGTIAAARGNGASIPRKVQAIDILFVALERCSDCSTGNVPDLIDC